LTGIENSTFSTFQYLSILFQYLSVYKNIYSVDSVNSVVIYPLLPPLFIIHIGITLWPILHCLHWLHLFTYALHLPSTKRMNLAKEI